MTAFFKYIIIFLIGLLLFPSSVEFAHIFLGHQHKTCNNYSDSHFHGKNLDCKLFSFQKTSFSHPELITYNLVSPEIPVFKNTSTYLFLNTNEPSAFEQRGPPALV